MLRKKMSFPTSIIILLCISICTFILNSSTNEVFTDTEQKYQFKVLLNKELTHDTELMRFGISNKKFNLPIGQHIYLSALVNGTIVERAYAPLSVNNDRGYFDLAIKVVIYEINDSLLKNSYLKVIAKIFRANSKFPKGGKLTQFLDKMKPGEIIDVRGPFGRLIYKQNGKFEIRSDKNSQPEDKKIKQLGMIAGN